MKLMFLSYTPKKGIRLSQVETKLRGQQFPFKLTLYTTLMAKIFITVVQKLFSSGNSFCLTKNLKMSKT